MKKKRKNKYKKRYIIILIILLIIGLLVLVKLNTNHSKNHKEKIDSNDKTVIQPNLWENETYYIANNLSRYQDYEKQHPDLTKEEIITCINANLDHEFYTDSAPADLSKGMYTLVNKFNYLSVNYVPDDLVTITGKYARDSASLQKDAYDHFVKMADDASLEDLTIKVTTGYRSYNFQETLYNNYVAQDGILEADTYSARPGFSEHQLGYSADLTNINLVSFDTFDQTDEYKWLQKNAYKYGFIQRYPKDKEYITGYQYESWHYRYVGVDIATYIYNNNLTYEEYYEYFIKQGNSN